MKCIYEQIPLSKKKAIFICKKKMMKGQNFDLSENSKTLLFF